MSHDRGEILLGLIYDDVDRRLNPDDDECPNCGGEGYIADCFDGLCVNAEHGCEDCVRRCVECARHADTRKKAVRDEVIRSGDIDTAVAWLKETGRWNDEITRDQVQAELNKAAAVLPDIEAH